MCHTLCGTSGAQVEIEAPIHDAHPNTSTYNMQHMHTDTQREHADWLMWEDGKCINTNIIETVSSFLLWYSDR